MISVELKAMAADLVDAAKSEGVNVAVLLSQYEPDDAHFTTHVSIKRNEHARYSHICLDMVRDLIMNQNLDTQGINRARPCETWDCLRDLANTVVAWHNASHDDSRLTIDSTTGVVVWVDKPA